MRRGREFRASSLGWLCFVLAAAPSSACLGQGFFNPSTAFELSDSVLLDEADATTRSHLERAQASIDNQQWAEAIDTLRWIIDQHGDKVIRAAARTDATRPSKPSPFPLRRHVSLRDYGHAKLAAMPAEALALYRDQVDPLAERRYAQGIAARDPRPLLAVVEDSFVSGVGDDALLALGELAIERGDFGAARGYLELLVPFEARLASEAATFDVSPIWLAYPDSDLPLPQVQAMLVLTSILEGSIDRAKVELDSFRRAYGGAEGRLAGKLGPLADTLAAVLAESEVWTTPTASADWPTFGGAPSRNHVAPVDVQVAAAKWTQPLPGAPLQSTGSHYTGYPIRRVAEEGDRLLSYHPVLVGRLMLVNSFDQIRAFDAVTGKAAWGGDEIIYIDEDVDADRLRKNYSMVGVARFTMTAHDNLLFARMGNPVTGMTLDQWSGGGTGYLVCLDLAAEGRLVWRIDPPDERWAFEGSPVSDGRAIYVGLRRSDVRPQAHVAAYDASTGRPLWRRMVCAAETPAQGQPETTHNLLTLVGETIYYNTNLGAVAALSTRDGRVRWLTLYPRAGSGDLMRRDAHYYRDLTPCVYDRGMLFVAPSDCDSIFALDAHTGAGRWATSRPSDAVQLLGVVNGNLLASGELLWWIHAAGGKVLKYWPEGGTPKGYGRGLLAGEHIYWPTANEIRVFDQRNGDEVRQPILLDPLGTTSGNLLAVDGSLVIVGGETITALQADGAAREEREPLVASQPAIEPEPSTAPRAGQVVDR